MNNIEYAKTLLMAGKLVAIPTETVYGLGADANNPTAIQQIYTAKGRPASNPLIIHIPNCDAISDWAVEIPNAAWALGKAFWPGPLTLILKKHPRVATVVTGGQDTVALRVPNHPLALELLAQFKGGIAAPSANRSGKISPTTPAHVMSELGDFVAYILDGGPCTVGIESTIVSLVGPTPVILREGSITKDAIAQVLGGAVLAKSDAETKDNFNITVPGSTLSHYAPTQPLYLLKKNLLEKKIIECIEQRISFSVMCFVEKPKNILMPNQQWITGSLDPKLYARELYANLHALDKIPTTCILVEEPPNTAAWVAIKDRLQRASHPTI